MTLEEKITAVNEEISNCNHRLDLIEETRVSIKAEIKNLTANLKKLNKIKEQIDNL